MDQSQVPPDELRRLYVNATPRQRYRVALERVKNPHHGPNVLVNVVAALEGFSRALGIRARMAKGDSLERAYTHLRNLGPQELLIDHICPAYNTTPEEAFGRDVWDKVAQAVKFRNLLAHEATYLHGGTCNSLIGAARHVLETLGRLSGAV